MVRSSISDQTISDPMAPSQTGSIATCVNSLGRRTTVYLVYQIDRLRVVLIYVNKVYRLKYRLRHPLIYEMYV